MPANPAASPAKTPGGLTQADLDKLKGRNGQNSIDGIHGGGSQQRNITVTIGKLQESTIIHAATVKEGLQDMERMVKETLVRLINGAEMAVANG